MPFETKMALLCLLKNVLFEHHLLLCILISYMDKIMNFKRYFTFHNVPILVVTSGLMVIVVWPSRFFWVIFWIFSFICLPFNPVGIPAVYILHLELGVLSHGILFPFPFLLVCTLRYVGKEKFLVRFSGLCLRQSSMNTHKAETTVLKGDSCFESPLLVVGI